MINYRFTTEEEGRTLILALEGEFDTTGAQGVQDQLVPAVGPEVQRIVFDLSGVTLMASSGLRVIFFARDKIRQGMKVELRGARDLVAKVIRMSGIGQFVDVV